MNFCRDADFNGVVDTKEVPSAALSPLDVAGYRTLYGAPAGVQSEAAFLTTQQLTGTFTPQQAMQYNSRGGTNTVQWLSMGSYRVTLPRMGSLLGGNVL